MTDGTKWFMYRQISGFTRANKQPETGQWETDKTTENKDLAEMTMLCHRDFLFVRHKDAPNVPFVKFDKLTLTPVED